MPKKGYWATVRLGGGTGASDKIPGADLADKDMLALLESTDTARFYWLDDDASGSEGETVTNPDTNPGTKSWLLLGITVPNTGLHILDSNASHDLVIKPGSDLEADRELTLTTGDAARTITLSGNPTLADWFDQAVKAASNVSFGTIGCGTITIADGSSLSLQEDITFTGATTENQIKFSDNLAVALDFMEAANSYMKFVSTNNSEAVVFSKDVGIGATPAVKLQVEDASYPVIRAVRTTAVTSSAGAALDFTLKTSGNMAPGFGGGITTSIQDATAGPNYIAGFYGIRGGNDTSGLFVIYTNNTGSFTEKVRITPSGNIGFNATTFGTNAVKTIAMGLGTDPTADVADQFAFWGKDITGGNTGPAFRTENGTVIQLDQSLLTTDKPTFAGALLTDDLTLPKTSGKGIKIDTGTPTFGWRDLQGDILIKTIGSNDPDYSDYASTGIYRHQFKNTGMTEVFNSYHIPHDYVPGTEVYIHVHWSQTTIDTGGTASAPGDAKWYFDANYSKGHDRGAFPASVTTVFAVQTASGTIRKHLIAEVQLSTSAQIDSQDLEPDGIVTVRTYRDAADEADTLDQRPWVHHIDIHYQSTSMATKNKVFDFYA